MITDLINRNEFNELISQVNLLQEELLVIKESKPLNNIIQRIILLDDRLTILEKKSLGGQK